MTKEEFLMPYTPSVDGGTYAEVEAMKRLFRPIAEMLWEINERFPLLHKHAATGGRVIPWAGPDEP